MEIGLYRIMLFGEDIERLKLFYIDNFGFVIKEEIKGEWVVLIAGQMEIAFHKIGAAYATGQSFKARSNAKLIFKVESGLIALRDKLIANNVQLGDLKSFTGINSLFCDGQDPEGNVFQLEEPLGS